MTTQLGQGLDATANGSTRERRQDLALRVLSAFHSILRNGRVHGADNGVFDGTVFFKPGPERTVISIPRQTTNK